MSQLVLSQVAEPATPSSTKAVVYLGTDGRLLVKTGDGAVIEAAGGSIARNAIINGTFLFAQRQAPGTLTGYSNTTGRIYGFDRWGITNENASVQVRRVDTIAAPESGLSSRYYAEVKKITNAGKAILSQVLESVDSAPYRGRRVRLQVKAKNSVGSHVLRVGLLQLTSSGTADTMPATFASAFGSAGTDPTWGTNLAAITPSVAGANSTIDGSTLSCTLNSSWRQYGGVFTVPSTALNLIPVLFTNGQMAANDILHLADVGLFDGDQVRQVLVPDIGHELLRCQRYYYKTFDIDTAPAQNAGATGSTRFAYSVGGAATARSPIFAHPVVMRATPSATLYNPNAANAQARDPQAAADCTATSATALNDRGWAFTATTPGGGAAGNWALIHATMDAEL